MSTITTQEATTGRWSCPGSQLVLRADAPREQWLAERRKGIGGSDASTVAGVNPFSSQYALWCDKTGRARDKDQTAAMRWGTLFEPALRQAFTEDTGIVVRRAGLMRSRLNPFMQVSLDGMTEDGGIFESKTTNWRLADDWDDDQIADHAEVQVQHGLAVTGRSHAWVVCLVDGRDFHVRRVERDEALIQTIIAMESTFWHDYVLTDTPPPATADALPAIKDRYSVVARSMAVAPAGTVDALTAQRADATARMKAAEAEVNDADAKLRELLGDAENLVADGFVRATCKANGTFSQSRFLADHPDLAGEFLVEKKVFDLDGLKTRRPDLYGQYRARVLRIPTTLKEA